MHRRREKARPRAGRRRRERPPPLRSATPRDIVSASRASQQLEEERIARQLHAERRYKDERPGKSGHGIDGYERIVDLVPYLLKSIARLVAGGDCLIDLGIDGVSFRDPCIGVRL